MPSASPTGCPSSGCLTPLGSLAPQPPTGRGACLLEVHLPSMVPQNRQSLCPGCSLEQQFCLWQPLILCPLWSNLAKLDYALPLLSLGFPVLAPAVSPCAKHRPRCLAFALHMGSKGMLGVQCQSCSWTAWPYFSSFLSCVCSPSNPSLNPCCPPFPALQFTQLFGKRRRWYRMQCKWIGSLWAIWFHSGARQAWLAHHNTWKCLPFLQIVSLRRCVVMRIAFIIFLTNQYKNSLLGKLVPVLHI